MPIVLKLFGMCFHYWAKEREPIHVHVTKGDAEARFVLEPEIELTNSSGFKPHELAIAEKIVGDNREYVIEHLKLVLKKTNTLSTVKKLWFESERIYIERDGDEVQSQPLRFFPRLRRATDKQRSEWTESYSGLHWEDIDEDISFESFTWDDDDPLTLYHHES